jgi:glycerol kinase
MSYILALDQGTTSSRAFTFDEEGHVATQSSFPVTSVFPQPGWVEQDPLQIWSSQLDAAKQAFSELQRIDAIRKASFASSAFNLKARSGSLVPAIGVTNQRETTIVWERKTGRPIYNAIVWQDRRTASACDKLRDQGYAELIRSKTGLVLDPYFSATKLAWILENVPNARASAELGDLCFGTVDSWLIYKLTSGRAHVTDGSNASRTMLYNIHTQEWDEELLALFDIPKAMMPRVVSSSGIVGKTEQIHFGLSIPIAGLAGDQQAACYGQLCHKEGMVKNTYGTGGFMLMNTGSKAVSSKSRLLATVGWNTDDMLQPVTYFLEGSVFNAGASVQWLMDGLQIVKDVAEVETLATSVPNTGDVYLVPAFTGLGVPHWDSYARACMIGMTRGTTKAHIARAALEAIALQTQEVFEALKQDTNYTPTQLRVDGKAANNNLLMQMQADYLGVPVVRPTVTETSALGVSYLAGMGVRMWNNTDDLSHHWHQDRVFEPSLGEDERLTKLARWKKAVARSRLWAAN